MIVLDTSAIIELIDGTEKGKSVQKHIADEAVGISAVTVNELLIGARGEERIVIGDFVRSVHILPFDADAAYQSIQIEEVLKQKGRMIGKLDIFIAAICMVHKLPLLTTDKDFATVAELSVKVVA